MGEGSLDAEAAELLKAYCSAVDGQQLDQLRTLFTDDATFEARGRVMDGAERDAFFPEVWATGEISTHVTRGAQTRVDGDQIFITALLSATFVLGDGSIRAVWGHYDDVATRTSTGLRFTVKQVNIERAELLPVQIQ